jgi:hypothetical protein
MPDRGFSVAAMERLTKKTYGIKSSKFLAYDDCTVSPYIIYFLYSTLFDLNIWGGGI